jgi:archaellum biogenesis protein FlaJ (TadC family)
MSALAVSCLIFALTLGGILLGTLLRRALPEHHLSKDSQHVVRLGVGLTGTIAALVLGLLIAAAKGSFDTQNTQVKQMTRPAAYRAPNSDTAMNRTRSN